MRVEISQRDAYRLIGLYNRFWDSFRYWEDDSAGRYSVGISTERGLGRGIPMVVGGIL